MLKDGYSWCSATGCRTLAFPCHARENFLIKPQTLQQLWQGPRRIFVLIDECAPEDYLKDAVTLAAKGDKRLLSNQNYLADRPVNQPPAPLSLDKN